MSTVAPLAVGTRGTVGSLLRREIEYFRKVELESQSVASNRPKKRSVNSVSHDDHTSGASRPSTLGSLLTMSWRRQKRRRSCSSSSSSSGGGSSFLPSLCSSVEVTDCSRGLDQIPGFRYQNLREALEEINI
ncbi:hypothetical protein Dimus_032922 [Dionaea muscipula]